MRLSPIPFLLFVLFNSLSSLAFADNAQLQDIQRKLPDGSMVQVFNQSDGTRVKQILRTDGNIEMTLTDNSGRETSTIHYPDGRVEKKLF